MLENSFDIEQERENMFEEIDGSLQVQQPTSGGQQAASNSSGSYHCLHTVAGDPNSKPPKSYQTFLDQPD